MLQKREVPSQVTNPVRITQQMHKTVVDRMGANGYRRVTQGDRIVRGKVLLCVDVFEYSSKASVNDRPGIAAGTRFVKIQMSHLLNGGESKIKKNMFDQSRPDTCTTIWFIKME